MGQQDADLCVRMPLDDSVERLFVRKVDVVSVPARMHAGPEVNDEYHVLTRKHDNQRFSADVAVIPQAARLLSPTGQNILGDVILAQGESAVVTTGSVNVHTPYKISSFKETSCTGYLEKLPDYAFTPSLSQNCPWPSKDGNKSHTTPMGRLEMLHFGILISYLNTSKPPRQLRLLSM